MPSVGFEPTTSKALRVYKKTFYNSQSLKYEQYTEVHIIVTINRLCDIFVCTRYLWSVGWFSPENSIMYVNNNVFYRLCRVYSFAKMKMYTRYLPVTVGVVFTVGPVVVAEMDIYSFVYLFNSCNA